MTPAQAAAFVSGQAALLQCRVAGMLAANQHRADRGCAQAYGEDAFLAVEREFESTLGWNAVQTIFLEARG